MDFLFPRFCSYMCFQNSKTGNFFCLHVHRLCALIFRKLCEGWMSYIHTYTTVYFEQTFEHTHTHTPTHTHTHTHTHPHTHAPGSGLLGVGCDLNGQLHRLLQSVPSPLIDWLRRLDVDAGYHEAVGGEGEAIANLSPIVYTKHRGTNDLCRVL